MEEGKKEAPTRPSVQGLDFTEAWNLLSKQEQKYAYHFFRASWAGALIVPHQVSYESPGLFLFLMAFYELPMKQLEQKLKEALPDTWERWVIYSASVYGNMGNYQSFGNTKIMPKITPEEFKQLVDAHPAPADSFFRKIAVAQILPMIEREIFAEGDPYDIIGFPDKGGVSGYYSTNMDGDDRSLIERYSESPGGISLLNTRVFKTAEKKYTITVASVDSGSKVVEFEGAQITIEHGEFKEYLRIVVDELKKAKEFARSDIQREMLEAYITHFQNGDIEMHKNSQRKWIADIGPPVETNIGFIETYLDPANMRGYYEGMVAIVDNGKSEKFGTLVGMSEKVIPLLPWPPQMEKEEFLKPDFTSLEIICFASSGCPLGINIPNYDDIRQEEGFKNVYLYNSFPAIKPKTIRFMTPHQSDLMVNHAQKVYLLHVALHELLGHGVGKLFMKREDGTYNFPQDTFLNPLTKEPISTFYGPQETWNSKFGQVSASYEECRADVCGLWLSAYADIQKIFGFDPPKDRALIAQVQWLHYTAKACQGLPLYNPDAKKWGQAHVQGAYVFLQYVLQNQSEDNKCVEIIVKPTDPAAMTPEQAETFKGDEMFEIKLHVENLMDESHGRRLIREVLMHLQTYKSTGDAENGTKWYNHYSQVDDKFLKVREIVLRNQRPRRLELNHNLVAKGDEITTPHYPHTMEGIIESFRERFNLEGEEGIGKKMLDAWKEKCELQRVPEKKA